MQNPRPPQGRRRQSRPSNPGQRSAFNDRTDLQNSLNDLSCELERKIEKQILEVRNELKKLIRDEIQNKSKQLIKDEKTTSTTDSNEETEDRRSNLEDRLRREMEGRLATIEKERRQLDSKLVLKRFTERANTLLSKIDATSVDMSNEQIGNVLRQAVLEALRNRKQHLSHLTKLEILVREKSLDQIPQLLNEFFIEAGIRRASNPIDEPEFFTVINDPTGKPYLQVVEPAYVDEVTGQILRAGRLRHVANPEFADGPALSSDDQGGKP